MKTNAFNKLKNIFKYGAILLGTSALVIAPTVATVSCSSDSQPTNPPSNNEPTNPPPQEPATKDTDGDGVYDPYDWNNYAKNVYLSDLKFTDDHMELGRFNGIGNGIVQVPKTVTDQIKYYIENNQITWFDNNGKPIVYEVTYQLNGFGIGSIGCNKNKPYYAPDGPNENWWKNITKQNLEFTYRISKIENKEINSSININYENSMFKYEFVSLPYDLGIYNHSCPGFIYTTGISENPGFLCSIGCYTIANEPLYTQIKNSINWTTIDNNTPDGPDILNSYYPPYEPGAIYPQFNDLDVQQSHWSITKI